MTSNINGGTNQISIYNYLAPIPVVTPEVKEEKVVSGSSSSSIEEEKCQKEEIWKPIKRHPQFQVSSLGQVKDDCLNLKKLTEIYGYWETSIRCRSYFVHELVADTFIPKPVTSKRLTVDHIDFDTKNNKVSNLRWATDSQQSHHRRKSVYKKKKCTSSFKGVCLLKNGRWKAEVVADGKLEYLGFFDNEMDAAAAYDQKAVEIMGEFAVINDIQSSQEYKEFKANKKWRKEGHRNSKSRYYGLTKDDNIFVVQLRVPGDKKSTLFGRFKNEKAAALRYNEEAIKIYGKDYKRLNVISDDEEAEEGESNKRARIE